MSNEDNEPQPTCALCGARLTWFQDDPEDPTPAGGWWVDALWNVDSDPTDHTHRTFETVPASHLVRGDVVAVNIARWPTDLAQWRAVTVESVTPMGRAHDRDYDLKLRIVGVHGTDEHTFIVGFNCAVRRLDDADFTGE